MKAITVWQPWAQLLAEGKKHDETRSWRTNYRGEILIHAAKKDPLFGISQMPDEGWEKALLSFGLYEAFNRFERFPTGAIIGSAILTDCKLIDQTYHDFIKELCPEEFLYGDFTVGRYAWRFEKPQLFKNPIPASGKQGLWTFGENVQIRGGELFISGIPRYTCAAFPGDNIPPAAWPELDAENAEGGQVVAVEQEPQRIAIAMARAGQRNPEGARAFFKLIENFCKEAEHGKAEKK